MIGAVVFSDVDTCAWDSRARWHLTRFVDLGSPVRLNADDYEYHGYVFRVRATLEIEIRRSQCRVGGCLNDHFAEFAGERARCFRLSAKDLETVSQATDTVATIFSALSITKQVGVTARTVPDYVDPNGAVTIEVVDEFAGDHQVEADEGNDGNVSSRSPQPSVAPLRNHLMGMHVALPNGTVRHRYTPHGRLSCLKLAASLKPSASLKDALASAADILLGTESQSVQTQLHRGDIPLPSVDRLRMARLRLDFFSMMFERMFFYASRCLYNFKRTIPS